MEGNIEKAYYFRVTGRVQGVSYRYFASKMAAELGIKGWIRNLPDGSVEGVAEGEEDVLKRFLSWCKEGPPLANVEEIEIKPVSIEGYKEFSIRF